VKIAASLAALLACVVAADAGSQDLVLEPRFRAGDAYALSLDNHSRTEAASRGGTRRAFEEDVALSYRANVEVLEVDARGRPVRERHDDVQLTFQRPDGSGSLFRNGTSYEVRHADGGALRVFVGGRRADGEVEAVVVGLLATRFENGPGAALLDPGRPVGVGDSWALDRSLARRLLARQGLRVLDLGEAPRATLLRRPTGDGGSEVVLRYRIPVAWSEPDAMPPNTRTAESHARYEGEIVLSDEPHGRPLRHRASLVADMSGVVDVPGRGAPSPWSLQSSREWDHRTRRIARAAPGGEGLAKAASPPSGPARLAD
jgi:hypothetical protein